MDGPRRSGPDLADPLGGDRGWRPSWGWVVVAVALVAGGVTYGLMTSPAPSPVVTAASMPPAGAASVGAAPLAPPASAVAGAAAVAAAPSPASASLPRAAAAATPQAAVTREPDADPTPDISVFVNKGETPTMAEVIERLHQAGVRSGLGAFQPPGTRPPLVGLAVPEDFALPEGYVRHYQATDDGQRIEPILMFSPDHAFVDAAGRPVAIPADRVVPPALAPPGLPIRSVVIPTPAEPGRPGR